MLKTIAKICSRYELPLLIKGSKVKVSDAVNLVPLNLARVVNDSEGENLETEGLNSSI